MMTLECDYDTYISNVTRTLFNPTDPNTQYCMGGSVYDYTGICPNNEQYWAGFYERVVNSDGTIQTPVRKTSSPFLNINDRVITDGFIYQKDANTNRIVVLVGANQEELPPNGTDLGVFYSDNEGDSWSAGSFNLPGDYNTSTDAMYRGATLPALFDGSLGDLFDNYRSMCNLGNGIMCLWLEEGSSHTTGGLFVSTDHGQNWASKTASIPIQWNLYYYGPGSMKNLGSNNVALGVKTGDAQQPGLFTFSIDVNGNINWNVNPIERFISAEQLDVSGNNWAVYGRRQVNGISDNFNNIYQSTDNGTSWTRIPLDPRNDNPLTIFPYVHGLSIRPTHTNELWVATSGQGMLIYDNFGNNCPAKLYVTNNYTISGSTYFSGDIEVQNGGNLTVSNVNSFQFCPGTGITVDEGAMLTVNGTTFTCSDISQTWLGITSAGGAMNVEGSTFNLAQTPITWNYTGFGCPGLFAVSNTFNLTGSSPEAINATNLFDSKISGNQFNLSANASSTGISIINQYQTACVGPQLPVNIVQNHFSGGAVQVSLTSLTSYATTFYLYGNYFDGSSFNSGTGNYGIALWGNEVYGWFNNNIFATNNYSTPIDLIQSEVFFFGNNPILSQQGQYNTDFQIDGYSTAYLGPIIDDGGNTVWVGGQNKIEMDNGQNASNIDIVPGSSLLINNGNNCLYLNPLAYNFYIVGDIYAMGTCTLEARQNFWNNSPPVFNVTCKGNPATVDWNPATNSCQFSGTPIGIQLTDMGYGRMDTTKITSSNGGGGLSSQPTDHGLFYNVKNKRRLRDYAGSIDDAKNLVNTFDSSRYLLPTLDEMFLDYKLSDSTANQNNTNALFTDLKNYLGQKIQDYQTNVSFVERAYHYYLMSLVKLRSYQEAIAGYENIMQNSPDTLLRLIASWDRADVILIMNNGGGGEPGNIEIKAANELNYDLSELLNNKPVHQIAKDIFVTQKQNLENQTGSMLTSSKKVIYGTAVEKNITKFNPQKRIDLINKVKHDLKALLHIGNSTSTKGTDIPKTFNLYQNYPNPFNPITNIKFDLPKDVNVTVRIYDIIGRLVTTLISNEFKKAGSYEIKWDGSNFASGVYFYRIDAGTFVTAKKMVLIK